MAWIQLAIAGLLEVVWATSMKASEGFSRPLPSVLTVVAMLLSFLLLSQAMKSLPLGTAYAVWTGIGAVGSVIVGIALYGEPAAPLRLLFVGLILTGIVGLRFVTK